MSENKYKISILGPLGSGKGTQAALLSKHLGIPVFAMGDLLREAARDETDQGRMLAQGIKSGRLVPDEVVDLIFKQSINHHDAQGGYIVDGYPRTQSQFDFLKDVDRLTHVVVLNLSFDKVFDRILNREICPCGNIYHLKFNPPKQVGLCDQCGRNLSNREDDIPGTIKEQLRWYDDEVTRVINLFRSQNIVHDIDAVGTIDEVHGRVLKVFTENQAENS